MIKIGFNSALRLHSLMIKETGGIDGLREAGLLDAALNMPFSSFGGCDLYATVEEKAARLCHSLVSNHAFVDGNKRIGVLLMLTFLQANGIFLSTNDCEITRIGLALAAGDMNYDALLAWIRERM